MILEAASMSRYWLACLGILLIGCGPQTGQTPKPVESTKASQTAAKEVVVADIKLVNDAKPGEALDVKSCLENDKITVIEFYSKHNSDCDQMKVVLEYLSAHRPDLAIRLVNIDRKGQKGPDYNSPLAQQLKLKRVPAFEIYNRQGDLSSKEELAAAQIRDWYQAAKRIEKGDVRAPDVMVEFEKR